MPGRFCNPEGTGLCYVDYSWREETLHVLFCIQHSTIALRRPDDEQWSPKMGMQPWPQKKHPCCFSGLGSPLKEFSGGQKRHKLIHTKSRAQSTHWSLFFNKFVFQPQPFLNALRYYLPMHTLWLVFPIVISACVLFCSIQKPSNVITPSEMLASLLPLL